LKKEDITGIVSQSFNDSSQTIELETLAFLNCLLELEATLELGIGIEAAEELELAFKGLGFTTRFRLGAIYILQTTKRKLFEEKEIGRIGDNLIFIFLKILR
jgi:hypothetical protein